MPAPIRAWNFVYDMSTKTVKFREVCAYSKDELDLRSEEVRDEMMSEGSYCDCFWAYYPADKVDLAHAATDFWSRSEKFEASRMEVRADV